VVGLWKNSLYATTDDEGRSWSPVASAPSLIMAGAKVWGQRTPDGRYAVVYNPTPDNSHRWPLAVATGDDGYTYDGLGVVNDLVSPRRFKGKFKDYGHNYVRGIAEGNGTPPGDAFWVTYSENKEDIWVSRIPVPVRLTVDEPVHDTFDDMPTGGVVRDWNVHSGAWSEVSVAEFPSARDKSLRLVDEDPCECARAMRVFREGRRVRLSFRFMARAVTDTPLEVRVIGPPGHAVFEITFGGRGEVSVLTGRGRPGAPRLEAGVWHDVECLVDAVSQVFTLAIDGARVCERAPFCRPSLSVERTIFRTGPVPALPRVETPVDAMGDIEGADRRVERAEYYINSFSARDATRC
jgi:hypothetical protein